METPDKFIVYELARDSANEVEPMGTKSKFWFIHEALGSCLFKTCRPGTGEDWAEKISAELASLLKLPHAEYHLANYEGQRGIISPSFVPKGSEFVPGNELMIEIDPDYPQKEERTKYRTPEHVLEKVLNLLKSKEVQPPAGWNMPVDLEHSAEVFVGYLMLDAWIGNGDRHDENWGVLLQRESAQSEKIVRFLAPTFDHASSLGRNETDNKREERMNSNDTNFNVQGYAQRSRSAFFDDEKDSQPLLTFDAFQKSLELIEGGHYWLENLEACKQSDIHSIFARVPEHILSEHASLFAQKMLEFNKNRLLALRGKQ